LGFDTPRLKKTFVFSKNFSFFIFILSVEIIAFDKKKIKNILIENGEKPIN